LVGDGRCESGEQQDKGASLLQRFSLLLFDLVLITIEFQSLSKTEEKPVSNCMLQCLKP
jgi:hypothetical protein